MENEEATLPPVPALLPSSPPTLLLPPHVAPPEKWGLWGRIVRRYRLLLFRPKKFFAGMTASPSDKNELALLAFSSGLAASLSRAGFNAITGNAALGNQSWLVHWLVCLWSGIISALLVYWVGAAWYRFRLRLAGTKDADIFLVRRVYLSAGQIVAIPIILKTVIDTFVHDTPLAASVADPTWQNRMYILFPIWSSIVGFIGVRSVFRTRWFRAAIWFLVLPAFFYLAAIGMVFWTASSGLRAGMSPASDVVHRQEFSSATMSFSYPGNWAVMKGDAEYDAESDVQIRPVQDARVRVFLFQPALGPEEAVKAQTDAVMGRFSAATRPVTFTEWGNYKGSGRHFKVRFQGKPCSVWLFIAPVAEDLYLGVTELLRDADSKKVQPGLDLIRRSFRVVSEE